ncbi:BRI1 kinase inhibitor 1 [Jatropha curcas]|uniref:BRI1 kinase inhibitor 1 n=1 Tax=Jatropha curcas TaxID=180498 RepID=UPI0005FBC1E9|nr:BRI1 kinase inhibitor 1 [Jatropha curcas]
METKQQNRNSREKLEKEDLTSLASPTSSSSSPSHEFSFTISLHPSSTPVISDNSSNNNKANKLAIDLSPADDIFFHGHLLPLHLLSHLPVSPRPSINSLDSFTLPIKELLDDHQEANRINSSSSNTSQENIKNSKSNSNSNNYKTSNDREATKTKSKPKSFSLFGWRKGFEDREREEKDEKQQKKKQTFEVSHILKRYVRKVRPLLFFKGRREDHHLQLHRQSHSFSGNLSLRNKLELGRGRRGEYSAPASMRTSPTNSGLLVATATLPSSTSDSTMEELQAAIQAAIAHCKNSIAAEDKIKC